MLALCSISPLLPLQLRSVSARGIKAEQGRSTLQVIRAPLVDLCLAVAIPEGSLRACGAFNWMSIHWALLNPHDVLCSFIETILKVFHC